MKYLKLIIILPLLIAFQCNEDELHTIENDNLNETGLIGGWEISAETINGISDMLPKCCRFLDFYINSNPDDLKGDYKYSDDSGLYDGEFTIDITENQIIFDNFNNEQVIYSFSIDDSGGEPNFHLHRRRC
ncbi:hypothetical protein ACFQ0R_08615 [Psychroflexus salinarum]|uniref:Lipocalin-like domain-containing protein n=1 Tax=Psychroflexus salinarum TaxID=546024 RepID=A0ABW3GV36_9FLAO